MKTRLVDPRNHGVRNASFVRVVVAAVPAIEVE